MTKRYGITICVALMMMLSFSTYAQFRANGLGGGAGFGVTYSQADLDRSDTPGIHFRAFLRHSLSEMFEVELGAGVAGQLLGIDDEFDTDLHPLDVRLLLRPFESRTFSPHIYAGMGALYYHIKEIPNNTNATVEDLEGWLPVVPIGIGLQFRISDYTSFEINGGYNLAFGDELDAFIEDSDDAYFNGHAGLTMAGFDWNGDADGDGLTNKEEKELGTDPQLADTDGDGLNDGEEFSTYKTNPLAADSDGDGLGDREEVKTYKTNPNNADTDGDSLADGEEVNTHNTNPNKADSDGDDLSDAEEINTHKTDPMNPDMDNDGLTDGAEIKTHQTKATNADTDGDGLNDGAEVNDHKTNPLNQDTDDGSVADGVEVNRGTNPNNADDDVVLEVAEVGAKVVLDGIVFATGSATISDESAEILEKAYNTMIAYPDMEVEIHGYTDSTGSRRGNMRLSQRRADSVRAYLVNKGIDGARMASKGFGPDNPIATNETAEGRQQNRRIEFVRTK